MVDYEIPHPWKLIGYKVFTFHILYLLYKLPVPYKYKIKYKKKLLFDKFAKYAKEQFRLNDKKERHDNFEVYNLGPFKICIYTDSEYFSIKNLEWNLSTVFFDVLYPAFNPNYFKFILGEGPYESSDVFCEEGDYVVDAGANLGIFSFLSSIKVGDNGHVFAIEPINFFVKCMEESLRINSSKNISILEVALGSDDKEDVIYLDCERPTNSGLNTKSSQSLPIWQVKLDSLIFEKKQIPRLDFLKMDIEGSERAALLGCRETIFKFRPKLSICTYHLKDDPVVLGNIIKNINPHYKIQLGKKKLYARVQ
jgi:FkbM family methyltransferase